MRTSWSFSWRPAPFSKRCRPRLSQSAPGSRHGSGSGGLQTGAPALQWCAPPGAAVQGLLGQAGSGLGCFFKRLASSAMVSAPPGARPKPLWNLEDFPGCDFLRVWTCISCPTPRSLFPSDFKYERAASPPRRWLSDGPQPARWDGADPGRADRDHQDPSATVLLPGRTAHPLGRITLHLPQRWPWDPVQIAPWHGCERFQPDGARPQLTRHRPRSPHVRSGLAASSPRHLALPNALTAAPFTRRPGPCSCASGDSCPICW